MRAERTRTARTGSRTQISTSRTRASRRSVLRPSSEPYGTGRRPSFACRRATASSPECRQGGRGGLGAQAGVPSTTGDRASRPPSAPRPPSRQAAATGSTTTKQTGALLQLAERVFSREPPREKRRLRIPNRLAILHTLAARLQAPHERARGPLLAHTWGTRVSSEKSEIRAKTITASILTQWQLRALTVIPAKERCAHSWRTKV